MGNLEVLLVVSVLLVGGSTWWFAKSIIERLDVIIRQTGGVPPK